MWWWGGEIKKVQVERKKGKCWKSSKWMSTFFSNLKRKIEQHFCIWHCRLKAGETPFLSLLLLLPSTLNAKFFWVALEDAICKIQFSNNNNCNNRLNYNSKTKRQVQKTKNKIKRSKLTWAENTKVSEQLRVGQPKIGRWCDSKLKSWAAEEEEEDDDKEYDCTNIERNSFIQWHSVVVVLLLSLHQSYSLPHSRCHTAEIQRKNS